MKTFGKLLIGFILGSLSTLWVIDKGTIYLENHYDSGDPIIIKTREIMADYTRSLGYDVKDIETKKDEFEFGFH